MATAKPYQPSLLFRWLVQEEREGICFLIQCCSQTQNKRLQWHSNLEDLICREKVNKMSPSSLEQSVWWPCGRQEVSFIVIALGHQSPQVRNQSERLTSRFLSICSSRRIWTTPQSVPSSCCNILFPLPGPDSGYTEFWSYSSLWWRTLVLSLCFSSTWPHNLPTVLALDFPSLCDNSSDKLTLPWG